MSTTFNAEVVTDANYEVSCPYCGFGYLHHGTLTDFYRVEDGPEIIHSIEAGRVYRLENPGPMLNPSARRDGLTLEFWCEGCGQHPLLTIAQHKGRTVIQWAPAVRAPLELAQ